MTPRMDRRWWALLGLLVLVAHASLFGVGPVGEDFRVLAEVSRAVHPEFGGAPDSGADIFFDRPGTGSRPLAALSLGITSWLWTDDGVWTTWALGALRFENLLLLLGVSWVLASFLRRLVTPWTGTEQANVAGYGAMLMLMVHPLSVAAVASPVARGDLLGMMFGLLAAALFLRGRQQRRFRLVLWALPLTLAATLSSELGYLVPIWIAVVEYFSSRRYRAGHTRLRTALTTLVVFGAAAGLDVVLRLGLGVDPWPAELEGSLQSFTTLGGLWVTLLSGLTKLGVLIVPVNGANAGGMGFVVGALLLVAVVQPALHAGLSAPRFWISALCAWLVFMILAEASRADLRVGPGDFSAAAGLFPAVVVMSMGLALASTAVSGSRRQALPLIVACLLCTLARSNARGWRAAAKDAAELTQEVAPLIGTFGTDQHYLVVDAPGVVDLFNACPDNLAWMFDRTELAPELVAEDLSIRALSAAAFVAFARLEEFDDLRRAGLVVVFSSRLVNPAAPMQWVAQPMSAPTAAGRVLAWRNPEASSGTDQEEVGAGHWQAQEGPSPVFADPAQVECLTVSAAEIGESDSAGQEEPEIYWRARGEWVRGGRLSGVWLRDGNGRTAVFDPGSELTWLLGNKVDSLLLMGELAEASGADAWPSPVQIPGQSDPIVDGDDWRLGAPSSLNYVTPDLEEAWWLTLLDLNTLLVVEVACEFDEGGELIAPGAEEISRKLRDEPGTLAWSIERRVGELVLQRAGGHL